MSLYIRCNESGQRNKNFNNLSLLFILATKSLDSAGSCSVSQVTMSPSSDEDAVNLTYSGSDQIPEVQQLAHTVTTTMTGSITTSMPTTDHALTTDTSMSGSEPAVTTSGSKGLVPSTDLQYPLIGPTSSSVASEPITYSQTHPVSAVGCRFSQQSSPANNFEEQNMAKISPFQTDFLGMSAPQMVEMSTRGSPNSGDPNAQSDKPSTLAPPCSSADDCFSGMTSGNNLESDTYPVDTAVMEEPASHDTCELYEDVASQFKPDSNPPDTEMFQSPGRQMEAYYQQLCDFMKSPALDIAPCKSQPLFAQQPTLDVVCLGFYFYIY